MDFTFLYKFFTWKKIYLWYFFPAHEKSERDKHVYIKTVLEFKKTEPHITTNERVKSALASRDRCTRRLFVCLRNTQTYDRYSCLFFVRQEKKNNNNNENIRILMKLKRNAFFEQRNALNLKRFIAKTNVYYKSLDKNLVRKMRILGHIIFWQMINLIAFFFKEKEWTMNRSFVDDAPLIGSA